MLNAKLITGANIHREARDWYNRAITNGGSVSKSTLKAVSDFCRGIDNAGIRDRFSRLNLFCGENLSAALVPLYRNFNTSSNIGYSVDYNYSFVSTDYSSRTGLTGDGNNTVLDIGMSEYTSTGGVSPIFDSHLSLYCDSYSGSSGMSHRGMGCYDSDTSAAYILEFANNTPYALFDNASTYANGSPQTNNLGLTIATGSGTAIPNCVFQIYRNATNITASYFDDGNNYDIPNLAVFGFYEVQTNVFQPDFIGSLGAYSFGKYMTSSQVSSYYTILQKFQTALGRNV